LFQKPRVCGKNAPIEDKDVFLGAFMSSVQFILGRSGTGKSRYCIDSIVERLCDAEDNTRLIFLVPEQATYQAERAILEKVPGYHQLSILSFSRLEYQLAGSRVAVESVSRIARAMILQRILRQNRDKLKMLGPSANQPGLGWDIADTIAEIHRYGYEPEDIENLALQLVESGDSISAVKFGEIAIVLGEYFKFIEGRLVDPDIQLARACGRVADSEFLKGAEIWVDGFASFTGSESAILGELTRTASKIHIALCLDPANIDFEKATLKGFGSGIFETTEQTYFKLRDHAVKCKVKVADPILLEKTWRFDKSVDLAEVEKTLFTPMDKKLSCHGDIRVVSPADRRSEVQFTAREILRLVRENGWRYRDIAVVASELSSYERYIESCFADYGIPCFIDRRKKLSHHSVVELLCCALKAITGGFSHEDIFAYLKTDLVPVSRADVDMLENYCVAFGLSGSNWKSDGDWRYADKADKRFDEAKINTAKTIVREPLIELADRLASKKQIPACEFTEAVFELFEKLNIRETLGKWIDLAQAEGDIAAADEHRQFWDRLVDVFDALDKAFAECELSCEDYLSILSSAFSQMALALIPPKLDQVLVGSIERSRHPELKAVFLIGTTQKQFPAGALSQSILGDEDRAAAAQMGIELAPGARDRLLERQYLAYIAFTRASRYLCVTYPATDDKGTGVVRSQFIDSLESIFENLEPQSITVDETDIEQVCSHNELQDTLCVALGADAQLGRDQDRLSGLLEAMAEDMDFEAVAADVIKAIDYDNTAELDKAMSDDLFGKNRQLRSSASRLTTFAQCPYQHFAKNVLALKKRAEFKLEPMNMGEFYHWVLDAVTKKLLAGQIDITAISQDKLAKLTRQAAEKILQSDAFLSAFAGHSGHNTFMVNCATENIERCVLAIQQMVSAGTFRPVRSELGFGDIRGEKGELGNVLITLSDGRELVLRGKIDRLDVAETEKGKVAVVFDYKRTGRAFDWAKFFNGLDIQLVIYLLALSDSKQGDDLAGVPMGAFYMPIEVDAKGKRINELNSKQAVFMHKAKGVFDGRSWESLDPQAIKNSEYYNFYVKTGGDPYGYKNSSAALTDNEFKETIKFCRDKVAELAEGILSGRIEVRPFQLRNESACRWCDYKSLCRFDWQVNEYNYLESDNKTEVLAKISGKDGKAD